MHRSWAADKDHLASSLTKLAKQASIPGHRSPLWLLIFPEGTICSDDEVSISTVTVNRANHQEGKESEIRQKRGHQ